MKPEYVLINSLDEYKGYKKGVEAIIISYYGRDQEQQFMWGHEPEKYPCLVAVKAEKNEEWGWFDMWTMFLYEEDAHKHQGLFLSTKMIDKSSKDDKIKE